MIRPNMATMLSFLATDAGIAQPLLGKLAADRRRLVQPHHGRRRHVL